MTDQKKVTKQVTVSYKTMDELILRKSKMTKTLIKRLENQGNEFSLVDTQIVIGEDKSLLKFTLESNI